MRKAYLLAGSAMLFTAWMPASAQTAAGNASQAGVEAETEFKEIIVTATRREQTLQATPLAVTAVGADELRTRGIDGLSDIPTGSVPGMLISSFAGNPSVLAIASRGIGISDPTQSTQDLVVPVYIDGVPLGRAQGLGLELIDPERIEFLRGPQGQLFGRNAEGGAIQFVARRPSGVFGFDVSGQLGNYGLNRQRLRVDLPEFANLRLQGAIVHTRHRGYTRNEPKNLFSEQADFGFLSSLGYRFAAEWSPTANFRANYTFDRARIKDSQPYLVWAPVDIIGRPPFSPQPASNEYPDVVNSPTFNEFFRTRSLGHALTLQYDASKEITLKSITSYREAGRHGSSTLGDALVAGGSASGILRSNSREDLEQSQWYQEVQAIGTFPRFDITVGATYFREEADQGIKAYITGPGLTAPALGLRPAALVRCIGLERCLTGNSQTTVQGDSYGVYAQGTYTPPILDDKLELTAGIRYSDERKVAVRTYIQPAALPPFTEATPSGPLPPPAVFETGRFDPAFTIKYSFNSDINVYARYATAYRAGGANIRSNAFTSYGAEEIEAFELGLKSRFFDRRLTFNLAFYHNNITGLQQSFQEQPSVNPAITNTINSNKPYKVDGVEVEAVVQVARGLTVSAGYSFLDAVRTIDVDNPLTAAVDVSRFFSVQTPRHTGNVAVDYETPELGFGVLAIHADYARSSGFWSSGGGILVASLGPTYSRPEAKTNLLNGRIALRDIPVGGVKGEISAFVKNLTEDTNYIFGFDGAASGGGYAQYLQPPRTFGVEVRMRY